MLLNYDTTKETITSGPLPSGWHAPLHPTTLSPKHIFLNLFSRGLSPFWATEETWRWNMAAFVDEDLLPMKI